MSRFIQTDLFAQSESIEQTVTRRLPGGDLLLLPLVGCARTSREVIYVNQPMAPVRLIHEGAPGWWLSDALYEATLLRLDELKERNNE